MPNTNTNDLRRLLLQRFPFFGQLTPDRLDCIVASATVRTAKAGTVLFDADQPCGGFPLVLEGTIRVAKTAPNGREIVLYRVDSGESCILSGGCLMGETLYAASGVAETDVTLVSIPPALFQELMVNDEPFRRYVFGMYSARLAEVMELVEEVAFRKLDARLAQLLIHRGPVLNTTHQRIAEELGSVREIASRLLRSFEVRGWVKLDRERITVLDPKSLAELAHN
ncbi:MAG: Crp/Fnr family transcriptional regulator [Burkholderiales bacterium]